MKIVGWCVHYITGSKPSIRVSAYSWLDGGERVVKTTDANWNVIVSAKDPFDAVARARELLEAMKSEDEAS